MISLFHWGSFYFDWDEYAIRFRYVSNKYYIYLQIITDIIVSIRYGAKMLKYDLISVSPWIYYKNVYTARASIQERGTANIWPW